MTKRTSATLVILAVLGAQAAAGYELRKDAGANKEAIADALAAFRADLGGGDTSSGGGLFGGLRREINWDGASDEASDPAFMSRDQFIARGVRFETGGDGVKMSADTDNPTGTPILFSSISAAYATQFLAFTGQRTFSPIGSNRIEVTFFVPGGGGALGLSRGLGVVFSDVDFDFTTSIEYFTIDGTSLGKFFAPAANGNQTFSFLGVSFDLPIVARAEIVLGNTPLNQFGELPGQDAVITDDFVFGEAFTPHPEVDCVADANTLCLNNGRFRLQVAFTTEAGGEQRLARVQREGTDSGAVWFFDPNNLELLVKVLDACGVNDRFWFYAAAATDLGLEITVTDLEEDETKTYTKEPGPPAPAITDSDAFDTCP
jgi:hypothetical protein